jgi:hypothetical protein
MRGIFLAVPAILLAGGVVAQGHANVLDPKAKVPPVHFRSALDGYRAFAAQGLADWRKANEEVVRGRETPKPQPGKPESSGAPAHGGHK